MAKKEPQPYYARALKRKGTGASRDFTPSYAVLTTPEYRSQVGRCRSFVDEETGMVVDETGFKREACKREAHLFLPGGRRELRYQEYEGRTYRYPRDSWADPPGPSKGEAEGQSLGESSRRRLEQRAVPYDARTQSTKVWEQTEVRMSKAGEASSRETGRIRDALDKYRREWQPEDAALGLAVPTSVGDLI
ncbi:MAG: hypothetical protein Q8P12_01345, partial [bacterium]|nr:hypothetical protein [bacterium]